ncbi:MAG: D-alanyl-D-alanine carboxypeptidase/D-alanyl-D-alanine-endopeptidase [Niabella sp.]
MKKGIWLACLIFSVSLVQAQVAQRLKVAMDSFNADGQMKYAAVSLYVINAKTGEVVFDQNANMGLATASTEKIVTAATAMDMLGADYTYKTKFAIVTKGAEKSLYIEPSGDPTFGSWRWETTKDTLILQKIKSALAASGVKKLQHIYVNMKGWTGETIPDGWIWQDLGQYFGAASLPLTWRENQFDIYLQSGNTVGSKVDIVKTLPKLYDYTIKSDAVAGEKESGDNTYLYYPSMGGKGGVLRGTIPFGQKNFKVSASIYDPVNQFVKTLVNYVKGTVTVEDPQFVMVEKTMPGAEVVYEHVSPPLSSIVYWFLRRSINLYGEALLKTIALQQTGKAGTDEGVSVLQKHWQSKGFDAEAFHLYDGSGLSPQNRISTKTQVQVLQYAKDKAWFKDYYEGFPVYNDMKMKSGTINRVKGFAGYHKSKQGEEFIFSFLINNYSSSQYSLVRKMFKVLDNLK